MVTGNPNLLRCFHSLENCSVKLVIEPDIARKAFVNKLFNDVLVDNDIDSALQNPSIDGIIISTPAAQHFKQAKKALNSNKYVFVEKPLAKSVKEAQELIDIANSRNLILMSGHTFLYNDAVKFIKNQIDSGELGNVRYLYSQRLNLGRIRSDVDALWNFAPHDISIIQYLMNDPTPVEVNSHGMDFIQSESMMYPSSI